MHEWVHTVNVSGGLRHRYPVPSPPECGFNPIAQQGQDLKAWTASSPISCRGEKGAPTGNEPTPRYVPNRGSNPQPLAAPDDAPSAWSPFQVRLYCCVPFDSRLAMTSEPDKQSRARFPADSMPFPGCPLDCKLGLCCFLSLSVPLTVQNQGVPGCTPESPVHSASHCSSHSQRARLLRGQSRALLDSALLLRNLLPVLKR